MMTLDLLLKQSQVSSQQETPFFNPFIPHTHHHSPLTLDTWTHHTPLSFQAM